MKKATHKLPVHLQADQSYVMIAVHDVPKELLEAIKAPISLRILRTSGLRGKEIFAEGEDGQKINLTLVEAP